jgi:16S rRNA (guanine527-N7)-methyltransferase
MSSATSRDYSYNRSQQMDRSRIAELLAPFVGGSEAEAILSGKLLSDISMYVDILLRWNARMNLTAIRDPDQIIVRHFGESFFAACQLFPNFSRKSLEDSNYPLLADLGSGAGFPGIPIRLLVPEVSLTLIESNQKKAVFLREVLRALELSEVKIENVRAETLSGPFDVVALRAVERFTEVLPLAARLVALGGRLALLVAKSQLASIYSTARQFTWSQPVPIPLSVSRVFVAGVRNQEY